MRRRVSVSLARSHRRPLAACAALAFAATGLVGIAADQRPVEAQTVTPTTLVKNTGQDAPGSYGLVSGTPRRAQPFTTGTFGDGYVLDSIGIRFATIAAGSDAGDELTVTLQSVDATANNDPAGVLCTLTNPSGLTAAGTHYFAAPTGDSGTCPKLSAETTYSVTVERTNANTNMIALAEMSTGDEDAGGCRRLDHFRQPSIITSLPSPPGSD